MRAGLPVVSPLGCASRQARHDVALQGDEQDERRSGDECGHSHEVVPVRAVLADQPVVNLLLEES